MAIEINTKVEIAQPRGKGLGNLTLLDAKFFGRPNFRGEKDRFQDDRRKFTVLVPNELADQLRQIGWNVKTDIPTPEQKELGWETVSHLKVFVDPGSCDIWFRMENEDGTFENEHINKPPNPEALLPLVDQANIKEMDVEVRAWEYNREEHPGEYSARLVTAIITIIPNTLARKYGIMT